MYYGIYPLLISGQGVRACYLVCGGQRMSRHRETDFAHRVINQSNLWAAIQNETWLLTGGAGEPETPEDMMDDTLLMMQCQAIFASAHEYPGAGEA